MRFRYLDLNDVPGLPLVVELPDGEFGEADSPVAAAALVFGPAQAGAYTDIEDALTAWRMRVYYLEKTALMLHATRNVRVIVEDGAAGVLFDTATAGNEEEEEEEETPTGAAIVLVPDTDRSFLRTLAVAGVIALHEREDSFIMRPHEAWDGAMEAGRFCAGCVFYVASAGECAQYGSKVAHDYGTACAGFAPVTPERRDVEAPGGRYELVDPGVIPLSAPIGVRSAGGG